MLLVSDFYITGRCAFTFSHWVASFTAADDEVNKKATELLHRKNVKKEKVGDVLVQDIERLKKEVELLVNGAL